MKYDFPAADLTRIEARLAALRVSVPCPLPSGAISTIIYTGGARGAPPRCALNSWINFLPVRDRFNSRSKARYRTIAQPSDIANDKLWRNRSLRPLFFSSSPSFFFPACGTHRSLRRACTTTPSHHHFSSFNIFPIIRSVWRVSIVSFLCNPISNKRYLLRNFRRILNENSEPPNFQSWIKDNSTKGSISIKFLNIYIFSSLPVAQIAASSITTPSHHHFSSFNIFSIIQNAWRVSIVSFLCNPISNRRYLLRNFRRILELWVLQFQRLD